MRDCQQIWDTVLHLGNQVLWESTGWRLRTLVLQFLISPRCLMLTYSSGSALFQTTTLIPLTPTILLELPSKLCFPPRQKSMLPAAFPARLHGFRSLIHHLWEAPQVTATTHQATPTTAVIRMTRPQAVTMQRGAVTIMEGWAATIMEEWAVTM